MNASAPPPVDPIVEAAADWCMRLATDDLTLAEKAELQDWLRRDPRHREQLDKAVAAWQAMDSVATSPEMIVMRAAALTDFRKMQARRWSAGTSPGVMRWAAAALVAVCLGGVVAWRVNAPDIYATREGERRVIELSDGSIASLDAATEVRIHYTKGRRSILLEQGRARFTVAKDPLRPFTVAAAGKTVVATGTEFSVERLSGEVRVVLYEGRVAVLGRTPASVTPHAIRVGAASADHVLRPNQELISRDLSDTGAVQPSNPVTSLSWEGGQLVFDDEPLALAVERVNRYSKAKLRVASPAAGRVLVSGMFKAGDTTAFVDGVTAVLPLRAVEREGVTALELEASEKNVTKSQSSGSGFES